MTLNIGTDFLYIPKMGMPSLTAGVSFGFIAITDESVFYIPQMTHNATGYSVIKETSLNVSNYDGVDFWDVVPKFASEANHVSQLNALLKEMASRIEGSVAVSFNQISAIKIGFFAGFTIKTADKSYRFSVGGKRKDIEAYLKAKGRM
jgi:hypothetical protein